MKHSTATSTDAGWRASLELDAFLREARREFAKPVSLRRVGVLLSVYQDDGLSLTEIARKALASVSTVSRDLLDLADEDRTGRPGYRWIEITRHPLNFCQNRYRVTLAGKLAVERMLDAMLEVGVAGLVSPNSPN